MTVEALPLRGREAGGSRHQMVLGLQFLITFSDARDTHALRTKEQGSGPSFFFSNAKVTLLFERVTLLKEEGMADLHFH